MSGVRLVRPRRVSQVLEQRPRHHVRLRRREHPARPVGGGYATHLHLPFDSMPLPVPDGLDPIVATLFNPLGAGIKWAAMLPETSPGDVVAVLGPGIRGICAAVAAKEAGAAFVAMTGGSALATELG